MFKWIRKMWDAIPDCSWPFHLLIHWLAVPSPKLSYPITEKCEIPPDMVGHYEEGASVCINKRNQIEGYMEKMDNLDMRPGTVSWEPDKARPLPKFGPLKIKSPEECGSCRYWHVIYEDEDVGGMCMGAVCRRRSEYRDRKKDDWCGEYKRKEE